jgi:hypothetical protein
MPIRGGFPTCCASAAGIAPRNVSATVAGVRLSTRIQPLITFGYLIDEARSNAPADTPRRSPSPTPTSDLSNEPELSGGVREARTVRCSE